MAADNSEYVELFLAEARENLETLSNAIVALEADPADAANLDAVFRVAHSVKGMAATMGYEQVASLTHAMEDVFAALRERSGGIARETIDLLFECMDMLGAMVDEVAENGESTSEPVALEARLHALLETDEAADASPAAAPRHDAVESAVREAQSRATVRVEAERLDTLLHMIGELVVRRSAVEQLAEESADARLLAAVGEMTRASQQVQDMVMRVRMVPIDTAFARLPRLVRDLSNQLKKQVELEVTGRDTELDRTAVDALVEPLMHIVRNAIDHGIEKPSVRKKAKKDPAGQLRIDARHEGGEVVIAISDDGAGIDAGAVAERARKLEMVDADVELDHEQAIELLFLPGFSTRGDVTDVSGRGVGMDAVRTAVRGFGGDVTVHSVPGQGTTTQMRMPLTLAILPALVVRSAGDPYALQLDRVDRTFKLEDVNLTTTMGRPVAVFDEGAMPVLNLAEAFNREIAGGAGQFMVTVRSADRQLALVVDEMIGRRELVTRPVPERVRKDSPVSGGAVLASGEIAFIVDCEELVRRTLVESAPGGSRQQEVRRQR